MRASFRNDTPLNWIRVNDLPDFVYFNHQIHVKQGVGCVTCHGPVDKMPLMYQAKSLLMEWCLDCHRAPEKYLRPRERSLQHELPSARRTPMPAANSGWQLKKEYNDRRASST